MILNIEEISPEKEKKKKNLSACIWAKNLAGGSDIMYCQGK